MQKIWKNNYLGVLTSHCCKHFGHFTLFEGAKTFDPCPIQMHKEWRQWAVISSWFSRLLESAAEQLIFVCSHILKVRILLRERALKNKQVLLCVVQNTTLDSVNMLPVHTLNNGIQIPAIGRTFRSVYTFPLSTHFGRKIFFYHNLFFPVGTFQMRSVAGDDLIHRTIDTAFQCGYRLIGEITSLLTRGIGNKQTN